MYKTLIAGITALALTLTPAQAQQYSEEDIGKLLFGLITAGIVANAIRNNKDKDRSETEQHAQINPRHEPPVTRDRGGRNQHWINPSYEPPVVQDRGGLNPQRINPRHDQTFGYSRDYGPVVLPRECIHPIETRYGTNRVFTRHCLKRSGFDVPALPRRCAVRLLDRDGVTRFGFDPACMRNAGYAIRWQH